ncbi:hypothetical protein AAVH_16045 [Aphelenchoides avenae]|nr:hypothetical protein AAVH_16045 [Aphelenchus avenae]
MVSRLRYQLAMECSAKYFLLTSLTVAFFLAAAYHRMTCRLDYSYWFALSLVCMVAQICTFVVVDKLESFEQLPDSVFENGRIDREKIKQIREQKANERHRADREKRQRNCSTCRDKCRDCYRPLPPPP